MSVLDIETQLDTQLLVPSDQLIYALAKKLPSFLERKIGGKLNEFLLKVLVMCVQPIDQSSCYELSTADWAAMLEHCNSALHWY